MITDEEIEISSCPLCKNTHSYKLKVGRATMAHFGALPSITEKPEPVSFTRVFVCPTTNQMFEASFTIVDYPGTLISWIKDVAGDEKK